MLSILLLSVFGIANLFLGFLKNRQVLFIGAIIFVLLSFVANLIEWQNPLNFGSSINNAMMATNTTSTLFVAVLLLSAFLMLPLSKNYIQDAEAQPAEYYAILLFSLVGAVMMVSYESLMMLFVGIEILSVSMYVLTGANKRNMRSNEAAMKYFLQGSFATGIFLFGVALIYGASGSFALSEIKSYTSQTATISPMLYLGLMFALIGMLFKVSVAPFHFWTADVYDGAPTFFTMFMSTIVKTAGFAAIFKLLATSFVNTYNYWQLSFTILVALTLLIANITAVYQQSFKRMMAYSSVSHAGYLLLAVVAFNERSSSAILLYTLAYSIATISAFGVLILVSSKNHNEEYNSFNGLAKTNPFLAFVMTVAMLSLAGIPLTAGFFGKLWIFISAFERGLYWVLVIAAVSSTIGLYYYFKVIIAMYLKEPYKKEVAKIEVSLPYIVAFLLTTLLTITIGLFPNLILGLLK
ncbi:MAG: NADH-quinone oxidoreductase subunit N [Thermonemataceae bacterium]|nr:NADH-quinone oxidoreductase subunit N [Thermonemataceae bacterium]